MKNIEPKFSNQSVVEAVKKIQSNIATGRYPSNKELIEICAGLNINVIDDKCEAHLIHEILETAINCHLLQTFNTGLTKKENKFKILAELENLTKNLPTQSWRGEEQLIYQQFSTPPPVAFVMAQLLKPKKENIALEPSAGTGCLALWLKIAGCQTLVNEISERRRLLLEIQNFAPTAVNAEFLDDLLPDEIEPDLILMNPPFSASCGKIKNADSNFGFRHVKSALARLNKNGRLIALLGSDALVKTDKGRKFLGEIGTEYDLKAVFTLPQNSFYKYGTNIRTAIVCIEKREPEKSESRIKQRKIALEINCRSLEECLAFAEIAE